MNLASIILLLQMVLTLLSQPGMAQNAQVQALANQAVSTATQALTQVATSAASATMATPTPLATEPIVSAPAPGIVYNSVSYPATQANIDIFNEIQQTENNCTQQINGLTAQLATIQQNETQSIRALNGNGVPQSIVNAMEQAIIQSSTLAIAANNAQEESVRLDCQEKLGQLQRQLQSGR